MSDDEPKKGAAEQPSALSTEAIEDLKVQVVMPKGSGQQPSSPAQNPPMQMQGQRVTPIGRANSAAPRHPGATGPGVDAPEEELSNFFQQRGLATQGQRFLLPLAAVLGKLTVVLLLFCAAVPFVWNYAAFVRVRIQEIGIDRFGINAAQRMPVWTKKAKQFREQNTTELGEFYIRGGKSSPMPSEVSRNPMIAAVIHGYWPRVEISSAKSCQKWQASPSCSIRAWYLAYRGSSASLRPVGSFDASSLQGLQKTEQVLFLFAMSQAVMGQRSDQLFDDALKLASFDQELQRVIFDARIKNIVRGNQLINLPRMVSRSSQIAMQPADSMKWRALEWAAKIRSKSAISDKNMMQLASKQLSDLWRTAPATLKLDPVAFVMLAEPSLHLGLAKDVRPVAESIVARENPREFDPGLYREIATILIRSQMLLGQLPEAVSRAVELQKQLGPDATSSHLLGSALLATRSSSQAAQAVKAFQAAAKGQNTWQSQLGYFLALTRSRQLKLAEGEMKKLQKLQNGSNILWIKMAIAEYRLAVGRTVPDLPVSYYKQVAVEVAPIFAKKPNWPTLAEIFAEALLKAGKSEQALNVQAQADQLAGRSKYAASEEFMESPIGPFALLR